MRPAAARFQAMGTEIELLAIPDLPPHVIEAVRLRFEIVESHLSRFRPDSDLSRLNAAHGQPYQASPILREVLGQALKAARATGGRFDPTVLNAVEASGYRRSFENLGGCVDSQPVGLLPNYRNVVLRRDGTIVLKSGVRVDLGGFAKGWTVDSVADIMQECGSWVVNAGGDLRAAGVGPEGRGWLVGIEDPYEPARDIGVIRVYDAAVATSSTARRRWRTQSGWAHHLIDPATGRPAMTGVVSVTVLSGTVTEAEALTKAALLMGSREGLSYIESRKGCAAVFVLEDGGVVWSRRMEAFRED